MATASPDDAEVLLRLPDSERSAFKDPMGPVHTDVESMLAGDGRPIIAVGDVVATTLLEAGETPEVAVVDGKTEREPVDEAVTASLGAIPKAISVANPAGTISRSMIEALATAVAATSPTRIDVAGEEDLAVLPAILLAPTGATVVYGQPGEGMVAVSVTPDTKAHTAAMLERLRGDHATARRLLGLAE